MSDTQAEKDARLSFYQLAMEIKQFLDEREYSADPGIMAVFIEEKIDQELALQKQQVDQKWIEGIEKWSKSMWESDMVVKMGPGIDDNFGWYDENEIEASILTFCRYFDFAFPTNPTPVGGVSDEKHPAGTKSQESEG